ncbi:MAG: peptide chain release factor N(5)-glutamine methyltransferase [Burkholderiales bacterium]|nr:peptide chain release factor N(5)-glutamine methyltransferase [Burkholderiales bacterium]
MLAWLQAGVSLADCQRRSPLDALETRMLLMQVSGLSRIQLITQDDTRLSAEQAAQLERLLQRRLQGEPMAYLSGTREFFGLDFITTAAVLIPRPDTELLVELALQQAPPAGALLDLGTGSGAIAIAVAHQRPDLKVSAVDLSPAALAIARQNAQRLLPQNPPELLQSDWYGALPGRRFHCIVSNPPYIVKDDPHLSQGDLRFEPLNALTDHGDGLSAYRRIIDGAAAHLQPQGWILLEHGYDQAEPVRQLLQQAGFEQVQSWRDLAGIERVSGGQLY